MVLNGGDEGGVLEQNGQIIVTDMLQHRYPGWLCHQPQQVGRLFYMKLWHQRMQRRGPYVWPH